MKTTPEIIEDIKSTVVQYFVAKASDLSGYKVNKEKIEVVVAKVGRCLQVVHVIEHSMQVPQQKNTDDCGYYLLHFAEKIFWNADNLLDLVWVSSVS